MREGRSPQQIGRKGLSNHRWIVGGKLCLLLNQWGLIVGWACATANVADNTFQWLIRQVEEQMIVLSDTAFHAAAGDPANLKLCQRGEWEDRMLVETVLSMLTLVCHFKRSCIEAGPIFRRAWRSRWPPSMCWSSGMASSLMRRVSCPSRLLNLVCKILRQLSMVCKRLTPLVSKPPVVRSHQLRGHDEGHTWKSHGHHERLRALPRQAMACGKPPCARVRAYNNVVLYPSRK